MRVRTLLLTALLALLLLVVVPAPAQRTYHALQPADFIGRVGDDDRSNDESADDETSDETSDEPRPFAEYFVTDPRSNPDTVVAGRPYDRLAWNADAPAYPGDAPGSLTAAYDANAEAGLFGLPLPQ